MQRCAEVFLGADQFVQRGRASQDFRDDRVDRCQQQRAAGSFGGRFVHERDQAEDFLVPAVGVRQMLGDRAVQQIGAVVLCGQLVGQFAEFARFGVRANSCCAGRDRRD